jgi:amidase
VQIRDAYRLTATDAAAAIDTGRLSPVDLVQSCLDRATACEAEVRAWQYLAADEALMEARLRQAGTATGPLWSVPFGVKDIIDVAAMPTGFGTPIYRNHVSHRSAACVALLQEAGAVCLGNTVTTELAHFHPGKTRNPQRLSCTPGGSSSGSAAAVASGTVPVALGTQTTGSVLRPAAYCGVFGFKPSYGDVNLSGVMDCAISFDTLGWFARSVDDLELVRCGLLRTPIRPLEHVAVAGLRCGVFRGPDWDKADAGTQQALARTVEILSGAGASIRDVDPPAGFRDLASHHRTIAGFEFARAISWERMERGPKLSPKLLHGRCADGLGTGYEDYAAAQAALVAARAAFADLIAGYDVLLTPVAPGPAPEGLAATGDPVFNTAWTALHVPAVSVPAFRDDTGMPIGLQLVGAFRRDARLLAVARAIARALGVERVDPVG